MKKLFCSLIISLIASSAFSQAKPSFTQYILNNYILNPALTGIENYIDAKASYRHQWTGIEGAPVTSYFTIQGPINKGDLRTNINSFQVPGENPRGKEAWDKYEVSPPHSGLGLQAVNDKAGYLNRWTIAATYAYHKPLSAKMALSAGFSAGLSAVNVDRSKVDTGPFDDGLVIGYTSGELKKTKPELGAGLWLYSDNFYVGASVQNIVPGKVKFSNAASSDKYGFYFKPNYFATAGYKFWLSDFVSVLPSVMVQYWQPQLNGIHTNIKFQYLDAVWVGGGYRFSNMVGGYSAMAGLNVSNIFNVSYAYEVATTSRLRTYTGNTHEIMVGFLIGNKYGYTCPRNLW
jgi:type IX secretion system PorP/SprF family membrane protein